MTGLLASSPVVLHDLRRLLVVLHTAAAIVLIGSSTHHMLEMRHYLRGRFTRAHIVRIYSAVVAVSYAVTFSLGAMLYPSYRVHVRGLFLDRYAPTYAGLFDTKEMFASLALVLAIGLGAVGRVLRPKEEPALVRIYAATSAIVCAVVWYDAIIGLLVVSVRGVG